MAKNGVGVVGPKIGCCVDGANKFMVENEVDGGWGLIVADPTLGAVELQYDAGDVFMVESCAVAV